MTRRRSPPGCAEAVIDIVATQARLGIDIVSDGEQGKVGFANYVRERVTGFELADPEPMEIVMGRTREVRSFPEYYQRYFAQAQRPPRRRASKPVKCTGPIQYQGLAALQTDIENLKAAMDAAGVDHAFMPAIAPRGVGRNEYYSSEEAYVEALSEAMRTEYVAILDAGLDLQVDDAWLTNLYGQDDISDLAGDAQRSRKIRRAAQPRPARPAGGACSLPHLLRHQRRPARLRRTLRALHRHHAQGERRRLFFRGWQPASRARVAPLGVQSALPEGKKIIPGVITHSTNVVEHPELVADRICRFAGAVGRENVIAGADCGFSSNASYETDIPLSVVWEKFKSLVQGAEIASKRLWS